MRRIVLFILAMFVVVAALAPTALWAGDTFWHGVDIADSGMTCENMEAIHEAIKAGMTDLAPTPTGFPTGDMLDDNDRGLRVYDSEKAWRGFTLLNTFTGTGTEKNGNNVLIDMEGNIVNEWTFPGAGYLSAAKPLPGGNIAGSSVDPNAMMPGGGLLTQLDWDGEVVKQWDTNMHHDHEREGSPCGYYAPGAEPLLDGAKVLVLESTNPDPEDTKHISVKFVKDDQIRELDWDGNELFRWQCWEHFDELGLDEWAEAGLDLGKNYEGPDFMADMLAEDWSHGNAVAWVGPNKWYEAGDLRFHPENIIADFRSLNITIIIARHDHPDGTWKQGDIIWKLGPDYSPAGHDYMVGQIIGQHQAHMIPEGLPGAGNMLIFDNGGAAGYGALIQGLRDAEGNPLGTWPNKFRLYSRVLEIDPVTKQVVWEFKQPKLSEDLDGDGKILGNEKLFFSNLMSGMQRLPNGNTLICEADVGRVFEVTESGEVVWEYAPTWFDPEGFMGVAVYRAYRVPYTWGAEPLQDGVALTGLAGKADSRRFYKIDVPSGAEQLMVSLFGNADLYIKYADLPTTADYDCLLATPNTDETRGLASQAGTWYLMLTSGEDYAGVTLEVRIYP